MPDVCAQKIYGAKWHVKMFLNQYIVYSRHTCVLFHRCKQDTALMFRA